MVEFPATAAGRPGSSGTTWPSPPLPQPPRPPQPTQPPRRTEPVHIPSVAVPMRQRCDAPAEHYVCVAAPGRNPGAWTELLNERFAAGYHLAHIVAGDAAPLLVFEHDAD